MLSFTKRAKTNSNMWLCALALVGVTSLVAPTNKVFAEQNEQNSTEKKDQEFDVIKDVGIENIAFNSPLKGLEKIKCTAEDLKLLQAQQVRFVKLTQKEQGWTPQVEKLDKDNALIQIGLELESSIDGYDEIRKSWADAQKLTGDARKEFLSPKIIANKLVEVQNAIDLAVQNKTGCYDTYINAQVALGLIERVPTKK